MGSVAKPNDISEEDYRAIEEAVMETARGRWFLMEFAKRNRVSDTVRVVDAIESLKSYITKEHDPADMLQMRLDIVDMTQTIERIKIEIANTGEDGASMSDAQVELNVVVDETADATHTILAAAEKTQEIVWQAKEAGMASEQCDKLDELITDIYMACSFQDLTGQRLRKVVQLISVIEQRLKNMVSLWDAAELNRYRQSAEANREDDTLKNGPALPGQAQQQIDIDAVMQTGEEELDEALDWSDENEDASKKEDEFFVIDDDLDAASDPNLIAFDADTEDEMTYQAPPAEEIIEEDDLDEHDVSVVSAKSMTDADAQQAVEFAPLHERMAKFS